MADYCMTEFVALQNDMYVCIITPPFDTICTIDLSVPT
jgi:hypothetical protein